MRLLFDFLTLSVKTGAGEYVRRVFFELLKATGADITIFALYDKSKGIAYQDMQEAALRDRGVCFLDCSSTPISSIVKENSIETFFIGCAQYVGAYDGISNIGCRVVCVTHDLSHEEWYRSYRGPVSLLTEALDKYYVHPVRNYKMCLEWNNPINYFYRRLLGYLIKGFDIRNHNIMPEVVQLVKKNPKSRMVVVSEYSKYAMNNLLDVPVDKISVLYSPERIFGEQKTIENPLLKTLVESGRKYYLFVSANRSSKNPKMMLSAFERYAETHEDACLATLGIINQEFKNHIALPFLSDSDLTAAYRNCYALVYPTVHEGFGYPPLEAMKFGKPVIASYCTSLPEVLGDAPIYFSPLYLTEIYCALHKLNDDNYTIYSEKSLKRYYEVKARQEEDLSRLIEIIIKDE